MPRRRSLAATCERFYRTALVQLGAERLVRQALLARASEFAQEPLRVLAMGKAAVPMTRGAVAVLGERAGDLLIVAPEVTHEVPWAPPGARFLQGGHPKPTAGSLDAGLAVEAWASAGDGRPTLVLLSGGASALVVAPARGVTAEEKIQAVSAVMASGATIQDMNAVRKHLSRLKGGQLMLRLGGARADVLVLSDVPGDDLSVIASGPFAGDPSTFAEALAHLEAAGPRAPPGARAFLLAGARGEHPETPKPGAPRLASARHQVLAGPVDLARAVATAARAAGFEAGADSTPLVGSVEDAARHLGALAMARGGRGPWLWAMGGEPTIALPSGATAPDGGRAQHLALLVARAIAGLDACVLAAGSDGRDGPTQQAGAVVDGLTSADARAAGVDLDEALAQARSGPAAVACGAAIERFDSPTHLADVMVVAVE